MSKTLKRQIGFYADKDVEQILSTVTSKTYYINTAIREYAIKATIEKRLALCEYDISILKILIAGRLS